MVRIQCIAGSNPLIIKQSDISLHELHASTDAPGHIEEVNEVQDVVATSRFNKSEFDTVPIYRPVIARWRLVVILSWYGRFRSLSCFAKVLFKSLRWVIRFPHGQCHRLYCTLYN
jgi:hypothetical protein